MIDLEREVLMIKERNLRLEAEKAWETSKTRRALIAALTYAIFVLFFFLAEDTNPFLSALVPTIAFGLLTLSLRLIKRLWLQKQIAKKSPSKNGA